MCREDCECKTLKKFFYQLGHRHIWCLECTNLWFALLPARNSFHDLDYLLLEMPNLLEIESIIRFVSFQKDDVYILIQVGRCFFDLYRFDHIEIFFGRLTFGKCSFQPDMLKKRLFMIPPRNVWRCPRVLILGFSTKDGNINRVDLDL